MHQVVLVKSWESNIIFLEMINQSSTSAIDYRFPIKKFAKNFAQSPFFLKI